MADSGPPFVFVTVGTDHHPFNRLIDWVDAWLPTDRSVRVRCFVQSGTSKPPQHAPFKAYLSPREMVTASGGATAVVSQGGPGTITNCRRQGVIPIVVPRQRRWGEAVDDHQVAFAHRLAERQEVFLAETRAHLWALLDLGLRDPAPFRSPRHSGTIQEVTERVAELVDDLVAAPRPRSWRQRREVPPWRRS